MPMFPDSIETEHLLDVHVDLEPPQDLGSTPLGARRIFIVKSGTFEGPKMRGTVLPAAAIGGLACATGPASWTYVRRSAPTKVP